MLAKVGIYIVSDFMATDPYELYAELKANVAGAGLNLIYAIIGARENTDWREVSRTRKSEILMRLDDLGLAPK